MIFLYQNLKHIFTGMKTTVYKASLFAPDGISKLFDVWA